MLTPATSHPVRRSAVMILAHLVFGSALAVFSGPLLDTDDEELQFLGSHHHTRGHPRERALCAKLSNHRVGPIFSRRIAQDPTDSSFGMHEDSCIVLLPSAVCRWSELVAISSPGATAQNEVLRKNE